MFFPNVHDEIKNCISQDIGDCQGAQKDTEQAKDSVNSVNIGWTPRSAYWLGVNFNLRIFERVFVGLDLCRNEDWVRMKEIMPYPSHGTTNWCVTNTYWRTQHVWATPHLPLPRRQR